MLEQAWSKSETEMSETERHSSLGLVLQGDRCLAFAVCTVHVMHCLCTRVHVPVRSSPCDNIHDGSASAGGILHGDLDTAMTPLTLLAAKLEASH